MTGRKSEEGGFDAKAAAPKEPKDAHGKAEGYTDEAGDVENLYDPKRHPPTDQPRQPK